MKRNKNKFQNPIKSSKIQLQILEYKDFIRSLAAYKFI